MMKVRKCNTLRVLAWMVKVGCVRDVHVLITSTSTDSAPANQIFARWALKIDVADMATARLHQYKTNGFPDRAPVQQTLPILD